MRVYFDLPKESPHRDGIAQLFKQFEQLCKIATPELRHLSCSMPDTVDLCDVRALLATPLADARAVFGMVWRFFPALDPQVDVLLSRDLDSRVSAREAAAVEEWIESEVASFHNMRDHPGGKQYWLSDKIMLLLVFRSNVTPDGMLLGCPVRFGTQNCPLQVQECLGCGNE